MTEEQFNEVSDDLIAALLITQRGSTKADPTTVRDLATWYKLNHVGRDEGCQNPDCVDTRPADSRGRRIVVLVKGQHMCRYCYLNGWLSDLET